MAGELHLKENVEEAVGKVAAEYSFAKDLQQKFARIEREEPDAALRDVKKGFRILRWIGRGQRRVDESEKDIIRELQGLGEILPQNLHAKEERLLRDLKVAEGKLVKAASRFTGELRTDLLEIKTDEQLLRKLEGADGEKVRSHLTKALNDAQEGIKELLKWLESTEAILKEIKGFAESLERLAA